MSSGQNLIHPNAYLLSTPSTNPSPHAPTVQRSTGVGGRTRQASQRLQQLAPPINTPVDAGLLEVQRFEDPNEQSPHNKHDLDYDGPSTKKRKKKGTDSAAKARTTRLSAVQVSAHQPPLPSASAAPGHSSVQIPVPATAISNATTSIYPSPQITAAQSQFQLSSATLPPPSIQPPTASVIYTQAHYSHLPTIQGSMSSTPSAEVPMGIWSDSSSPHGSLLHSTFTQSSPSPLANVAHSSAPLLVQQHQCTPSISSPIPANMHHMRPLVESDNEDGDDEDDEENDDEIHSPTSGIASRALSRSAIHSMPSQPLGEVANLVNVSVPSGSMTSTTDNEDVLESLRHKTKRRRRPYSRLATGSDGGATESEQRRLDKLDADRTNLNAYDEQERPFLHLARVVYGALLVTKEAMPHPGTARNLQREAYVEAGNILRTGIPLTLPPQPDNLIYRLIAKHGSTARGRIKTAALNVVIHDYGIKDGRADSSVIAARVAKLLDRKSFTYREMTDEGRRAGIFRHPAIANVLVNTLFRDRDSDGVLVKHMFIPLIPEAAIFMACMAIEHALEMWSSGVEIKKDFSNDITHRLVWNRHKATWEDYINRKGEAGEKYAQETRQQITSQIRLILDGATPTSGPSCTTEAESFFDDQDGD